MMEPKPFAWLLWAVHVGAGALGALTGALLLWPDKSFNQPAAEYWRNVLFIGTNQGLIIGLLRFVGALSGRGPRTGKRLAWNFAVSFFAALVVIVGIPFLKRLRT
jgi:hypothetical protein